MVRRILLFLGSALLLASCTGHGARGFHATDSTAVVRTCLENSQSLSETNRDSSLALLLRAIDYCQGCEPSLRYDTYKAISEMYEQKNLYEPQQKYQGLMAKVAHDMGDREREAEAVLRMSATDMVMGDMDQALSHAREAYRLASSDSLEFRAHCMLMQSQVFIQTGETDSVSHCLTVAQQICPSIRRDEMFRLSDAYRLSTTGERDGLDNVIQEYKRDGSVFLCAELTRLQMSIHEDEGRWQQAYCDANELLALSDSIAQLEASKSMARIHELQHEQQMERNRAERAAERASLYFIIMCVLVLLLTASVLALVFRRRAIIAHKHELEAMRLADQSQASEAIVREENIQLQKLYYEHLYAIILPILNARRGKTGHINLEESSWRLIEENTDMVLPNFTSRLRHKHPTLSNDDVRFCCMIMMRVPNAVLADVYCIAPSSVAIRKQRMKKKLDADIHEQTIEDYLGQCLV